MKLTCLVETEYSSRCRICGNKSPLNVDPDGEITCKNCGVVLGVRVSPNLDVTIMVGWEDMKRWRKMPKGHWSKLSKQGMWVRPNPAEDVRRLNAEKVLDIGCGNGRHMIFPVSVGMDNDPRAVAMARGHGPVVLGDAHHLPFRDGCFDIALLWSVLNFVEDPNRVYNEANRVSYQDPVYSLTNYAKNARWTLKEKEVMNDESVTCSG